MPGSEKLNQHLIDLISAIQNVDAEGVQKSNRQELGGWHSHAILHKIPEFEGITSRVHECADWIASDLQYDESRALRTSSMWAIVNPPGAFNLAHIHPGCLWSGVYYVQAPRGSGKISFTDPRVANIMNKPVYAKGSSVPKKCWTKVSFTPTPGRMILFPSWLYHSVGLNRADPVLPDGSHGERIIISFNLKQIMRR